MKKGTRVTIKRRALVNGAAKMVSTKRVSRVGRITGERTIPYRGRTYYAVRFSNGFTHYFTPAQIQEVT